MSRSAILAGISLGLLASASAAAAQEAAPASSEEVVVTGQRTEEAIRTFVDEVSVAMGSADQLARWDRRICPGVAGLRGRYAQFLIDRMAQRAFDVGLDVGDPGCRANMLIIVTLDPDAMAQQLLDDHPDALGYFRERGRNTLGRTALRAFVESDAPVRWWHVSRTATEGFDEIGETADGSAPVTFALGNASRLSRSTHQNFGAAFIIVDARHLAEIDLDFGALADYVAMVALAQVDADASTTGLTTILNLFNDETSPRALTEWDIAYLRGLYGAESTVSARRQAGDIARTMGRDLPQQ
jgi:hypothetical protein